MAGKANKWLSVRAVAQELGVSHTAVQKAILAGRITAKSLRKDPKRPKWTQVHVDRARADLAANTDLAQVRDNVRQPGPAKDPDPEQGKLFGKEGAPPDPAAEAARRTYARHRATREEYTARLEALKLKQLEGQLVRAEDVMAERFNAGRVVREALRNIPGRIAAELAACDDVHVVEARLADEIDLALRQLVVDQRKALDDAADTRAAAG